MKNIDKLLFRVLGLFLGFSLLAGSAIAQSTQDSNKRVTFTENVNNSQVRQNPNPLITLELDQVSLREALKHIADQAEAGLYYNTAFVPEKRVSLHLQAAPLDKALQKVLEGTSLRVIASGRNITLRQKREIDLIKLPLASTQETITGTVADAESGESLPGVNILVKGTTTGASTDAEGNFELTVESLQDTLVVSFVGYQTREVPINGRTEIDISLKVQAISGQEMVVVGYGTQKKSSVTGSITKVENEELDQIPVGQIGNALEGKLAGVNIVNNSNRPGQSPRIRIRGVGSIDAGNDPLVVIDGFPGGSLRQLNMNDVESIEVLKDAAATAIYGSRGAGGVIMVTTKQGSGEPELNLNAQYGISSPYTHDDWLMGKEWYNYLVKHQNRKFRWAGGDVSLPMFGDQRRPVTYQVNPKTYELPQTNWQNEVTQKAPISSYNASIGGKINDTRYYVSGSYRNEEGVIKTGAYEQFNFRLNLDTKINDWMKLGFQLSPSYSKRRTHGKRMVSLVKYPPFVPPNKVDGKYPRTQDYIPTGHSAQASPYVYLYGRHDNIQSFENIGRGYIDLSLTDGLRFKSSLGTNIGYNTSEYFQEGLGDQQITSEGSTGDTRSINIVNENTLNYDKTFKLVHDLAALVGASFQHETVRSTDLDAVSDSYNNEIIRTLNNAVIDPSSTSSRKTQWGLISYFGRLNYAYDNKYLFSASIRTDGSSRFGSDKKWALFPAFSIGWRIANERFMQNLESISALKIRASYGNTGNFNIGNYSYLSRVGFNSYSPGGSRVVGLAPISFGNSALGWEKTESYNLGLELGLYDNRFYLNLDLYDSKTTNLLYNVSIPAITGFSNTLSNVGEINNKGIELELTSRNMAGSFSWETTFNLARNINEVVDLGEDDEYISRHYKGMNWLLREGKPMFSYYGYKIDGIYQTEEQIENSPSLPNTVPGNPIIKDRNGDDKIDPGDKVTLGNYQPDITMGMVNNFSWENFDLSFTLDSSVGAEIYHYADNYYSGAILGAMRRGLVEDQWYSTEDPGDGKTPALDPGQSARVANTDYYIEDASYLALRNLNLGYTFSSSTTSKMNINRLRIYASFRNIFVLTSKGNDAYNPIGTTSNGISGLNSIPGYSRGSDPLTRVFSLGVSLGL